MPRPISSNLDAIMTRSLSREPAWEVLIYDIRSTNDTIRDVVLLQTGQGGSLELLAGPSNFTPDTVSVQVQEQRGDYVNGGIQSAAVTLTIVDESGLMDPVLTTGLSTSDPAYAELRGRYLRKGNVVTLRLGDQRVDSSEWPLIFTGEIVGQAGRQRSRSDGAQSTLEVRALSREAHFLRFNRTSDAFAAGLSYKTLAETIAQDEMGLDTNEVSFANWGSTLTVHTVTQLVDEAPIVMLAKLMLIDGVMPRFTGEGILSQITSTISGAANRVYQNLDTIRKIDRPYSDIDQPNCVEVVGLDAALSQVVQPSQVLASADITTGFFANDEDFNVYWSDDRTIVALNAHARVLVGVNSGISILGGSEQFTLITNPSALGGGSIGMNIQISTGYAPWIVVFLLATYVVLSATPDLVAALVIGETIPLGRIIQASALASALWVMTKIGHGQYEFRGEPVEFVYAELRCRACVEDPITGAAISSFDRDELTIENHLISNKTDARNVAKNELLLLQAQENPRDVEMFHDLKLEPDDIFEIPGGRFFLIDNISYTLVRDSNTAIRARLSTFEVTPGVLA